MLLLGLVYPSDNGGMSYYLPERRIGVSQASRIHY